MRMKPNAWRENDLYVLVSGILRFGEHHNLVYILRNGAQWLMQTYRWLQIPSYDLKPPINWDNTDNAVTVVSQQFSKEKAASLAGTTCWLACIVFSSGYVNNQHTRL